MSDPAPAPRPPGPGRATGRPSLLPVALFLAVGLLAIAAFMVPAVMVNRLSRSVTDTSDVLARFCAEASFPATRDSVLERMLTTVIANIDFPILITDEDSLPRAWRHVGIDPALVPDASLDSMAAGRAVSPRVAERVTQLQGRARQLDGRNRPIPMIQPATGRTLGLLHYGDSPVLERLRWMPYLTTAGLLVLVAFGAWGIANLRRAERRSIWVGMARETAHQMGTPLSALLGWIELLRGGRDGAGGEVQLPRAELDETLDEMERDVERLNKVAQRFSHIGSTPRLESRDVTHIAAQAVAYVRRRLPQSGPTITLRERYELIEPLPCDAELLEWVFENLLANAATALDKNPAWIEVDIAERSGGGVEVVVRDNGRGMSLAEQRRAFRPGYTTKRRGWGLGLALSRRIVEDYHRGRLFIRRSAPGEGTTLVVLLPR